MRVGRSILPRAHPPPHSLPALRRNRLSPKQTTSQDDSGEYTTPQKRDFRTPGSLDQRTLLPHLRRQRDVDIRLDSLLHASRTPRLSLPFKHLLLGLLGRHGHRTARARARHRPNRSEKRRNGLPLYLDLSAAPLHLRQLPRRFHHHSQPPWLLHGPAFPERRGRVDGAVARGNARQGCELRVVWGADGRGCVAVWDRGRGADAGDRGVLLGFVGVFRAVLGGLVFFRGVGREGGRGGK